MTVEIAKTEAIPLRRAGPPTRGSMRAMRNIQLIRAIPQQ
jgi:hypothetical protein